MDYISKIRQLHMERQKSFQKLLILELFVIVFGIVGLFGKTERYEYSVLDARGNFGTGMDRGEDLWWYVDEEFQTQGNLVDFTDLKLPVGTYRVQLHYNTDTDLKNYCYITGGVGEERFLQTNGAMLFSGLDQTDYELWVYRPVKDMIVHVEYAGEGSLSIKGLTLARTNGMNRMALFVILCLITGVNLLLVYRAYDRAYRIPVKNKTVTFCLGVIVLAASLPLSVDGMISGGDLGYHLMRVEGIRDGILSGQFPIRISPQWQQGFGYASPIFYGETVLYLAAFLRLIGFSVTASYRMFFFLVTLATTWIAYECFQRIFKEAYVGVFCSMLYVLSVYRIYKTYLCGSWGGSFWSHVSACHSLWVLSGVYTGRA